MQKQKKKTGCHFQCLCVRSLRPPELSLRIQDTGVCTTACISMSTFKIQYKQRLLYLCAETLICKIRAKMLPPWLCKLKLNFFFLFGSECLLWLCNFNWELYNAEESSRTKYLSMEKYKKHNSTHLTIFFFFFTFYECADQQDTYITPTQCRQTDRYFTIPYEIHVQMIKVSIHQLIYQYICLSLIPSIHRPTKSYFLSVSHQALRV